MNFEHLRCGCPGSPLNRREFLRVGVLSGLGLTLGDYFRLQTAWGDPAVADPASKADSVIFIFMAGGMSHIETFDPKPYAPLEYRGEIGGVETNTGDMFGGQFGNLAKVADKMTVIRSMTHGEAAHERGTHNMLTGYRPSPAVTYPSIGAVIAHEYGPRNDLPGYITIPNANDPFLGPGYLSAAYGPFSVGGEPQADGFQVKDLSLPSGVDADRMERRKTLLSAVDHHFSELEAGDLLSAMDSYYQRAYALISSQAAREAFNIAAEPDEIRNEYGRHNFGQRLLLSRRLVEAGARFVTVLDGGWDHHDKIRDAMRNQLPSVDQGLATLIRDLDRRGLLQRTLVVMVTEFGRTAKINQTGGRDHWPKVFSVALAGGGVKGGTIYGQSDPRGAEPARDPVSPEDLATTIYNQLGINAERELMSPGNRPLEIVKDGSVLYDILA
jgi:hypothetical protein